MLPLSQESCLQATTIVVLQHQVNEFPAINLLWLESADSKRAGPIRSVARLSTPRPGTAEHFSIWAPAGSDEKLAVLAVHVVKSSKICKCMHK